MVLSRAETVPVVVLFFALPLVLCSVFAPFLQSSNSPWRIRDVVRIAVVDFDGVPATRGGVGASLISALAAVANSGAWVPGFDVLDPNSTSPAQITDAVRDTDYFGAIWIPAGTTSLLQLAQAGAPGASYTPASAIQFVWDEGRSPSTTAGRVAVPVRALLARFTAQFAQRRLAGLAAQGLNLSALATSSASGAALLAAPVDFTETNLFPAASSVYVGVGATTIGLILMCVFALAGSTAARGLVLPSAMRDLPPVGRYVWLFGTLVVIGASVSAAYATIVSGMAFLTSQQWAQLWATTWCLYVTIALFLAAVGLVAPTEQLVTLSFLYVLVYNVIGGWNIDMSSSDAGFEFFKYAPFYHTNHILRFVLFGSWRSRLSEACGILNLWLGVDVVIFCVACVVHYRRNAALAAAAANEAKTVPAPASSSETTVTQPEPELSSAEAQTVYV